ncbi:MAG TPA: hypothetical protein VLS93_03065 [Anaeromyxobacteraceae bacterium]|nr:hypothetical protein [Anaeromyxobacteraceae bacterium]
MPHFGLMDEKALGPVEGPLRRARLHVRGGKRRLRQGKIAAGVAALYDALSAAMQWYVALPARREALAIGPADDLGDDRSVHALLVRSGVLDGRFDLDSFARLMEEERQQLSDHEQAELLAGLEAVMTQLGVMPFDEASLPPEDPGAF